MSINTPSGALTALPTCPESPNCVSSQATDAHHIEPLAVTGEGREALEKLRRLLAERRDTTLISMGDTTLRVEFRTTLGFVDDGLFVLDLSTNLIHVRSAARLGYWDLGKNRSRMEEIRQGFERATRISP
ncbi:MAG: DUF1499 domain-containing protein [Pelobacteraceae bacterium]